MNVLRFPASLSREKGCEPILVTRPHLHSDSWNIKVRDTETYITKISRPYLLILHGMVLKRNIFFGSARYCADQFIHRTWLRLSHFKHLSKAFQTATEGFT